MKTRPILFSGAMVRAILDGSKTQTRRTAKVPCDCGEEFEEMPATTPEGWMIGGYTGQWRCKCCMEEFNCPYGKIGDKLWVRETWRAGIEYDDTAPRDIPDVADIAYVADNRKSIMLEKREMRGKNMDIGGKSRPSIFMMEWMSRIALEITGIRLERLHDISEVDAIAEGVIPNDLGALASATLQRVNGEQHSAAYLQYAELWQSINGPGSWDKNPWVWVIEFRRSKP